MIFWLHKAVTLSSDTWVMALFTEVRHCVTSGFSQVEVQSWACVWGSQKQDKSPVNGRPLAATVNGQYFRYLYLSICTSSAGRYLLEWKWSPSSVVSIQFMTHDQPIRVSPSMEFYGKSAGVIILLFSRIFQSVNLNLVSPQMAAMLLPLRPTGCCIVRSSTTSFQPLAVP